MEVAEAYQVLSDFIYKGFITIDVSFYGHHIVFKTVNDRELGLIRFLAGSTKNKFHTRYFNDFFMAISVLSLDGINVLAERDKNLNLLFEFFRGIPEKVKLLIFRDLNKLKIESYESLEYIEGFCYTHASRNYWRILNNNLPTQVSYTGIPGTSNLGLNIYQDNWISINRSLDLEEVYQKDFSMALLIASSSNPKGVKKIRNQFDENNKIIEERRRKLASTGKLESKSWSPDKWSAPVETAEELVAELNRQMRGEKDRHDLFIEEHLRKIREAAERKKEEAEKRLKEFREGRESGIFGESRALTLEESSNLMAGRVPSTIIVPDENHASYPEKDRFLSKIGTKVLTPRK